ncbi:hypothetical protein FTUN_0715 [Frigoriglobus tundricola]|uniref:Uncharacterized protein n=2 Tax=Frigoriglobus tundricola TaxID=2774151 RepID=A0A6M5YIQ5_9BACT|nr:hypothetical protein FTUN_0715 [Frigoriglobus tundricola]
MQNRPPLRQKKTTDIPLDPPLIATTFDASSSDHTLPSTPPISTPIQQQAVLDNRLYRAARDGGDVQHLIDQGANPNWAHPVDAKTAIMLAASQGNGRSVIVRQLIAAGANVDATDEEGMTALHHAAYKFIGGTDIGGVEVTFDPDQLSTATQLLAKDPRLVRVKTLATASSPNQSVTALEIAYRRNPDSPMTVLLQQAEDLLAAQEKPKTTGTALSPNFRPNPITPSPPATSPTPAVNGFPSAQANWLAPAIAGLGSLLGVLWADFSIVSILCALAVTGGTAIISQAVTHTGFFAPVTPASTTRLAAFLQISATGQAVCQGTIPDQDLPECRLPLTQSNSSSSFLSSASSNANLPRIRAALTHKI